MILLKNRMSYRCGAREWDLERILLAAAIGLQGGEEVQWELLSREDLQEVQWELLSREDLHLLRPNAAAPRTRRRATNTS